MFLLNSRDSCNLHWEMRLGAQGKMPETRPDPRTVLLLMTRQPEQGPCPLSKSAIGMEARIWIHY
jgi:hypothetical protein